MTGALLHRALCCVAAVSPRFRSSYPISTAAVMESSASDMTRPADSGTDSDADGDDAATPILIFRVYYHEDVDYSSIERCRIRKLILVYHVEDCSLQLIEPHEDNSGLEQGVFLSRQVRRVCVTST